MNEKQAAARRVAIVSIICPLGSVGKGGDSEKFGVHIITTSVLLTFLPIVCSLFFSKIFFKLGELVLELSYYEIILFYYS